MVEIPEGYIPHDGGPCPVPLDSKPGVVFADGCVLDAGENNALVWSDYGSDWWRHEATIPGYNIIAYLPDLDYVAPTVTPEPTLPDEITVNGVVYVRKEVA